MKQTHNQTIIILGFMIYLCSSLQFSTQILPQQRFCFYEVFEPQQKYSFTSQSKNASKQEVEVSHIDSNQWKSVFFKSSQQDQSLIRVDKLASSSTTYSFCVRNIMNNPENFQISFHTGIDMLELHNLPDATDGQNLDRQLSWLEKQIQALTQRSQNIQGLRRINMQISGMVGTKMVILAIIGLVAIGGANFFFYRLLKNELKKRKLI